MTRLALCVALIAAAVGIAPSAHADTTVGNYLMDNSARDPGHTWIWAIRDCSIDKPASGFVRVQATPRPNGPAAPYDGDAPLVNGRYTLTVDVPDGVRRTVYFLPSHDVYSWDAVSLTGSVDSSFDEGCGGAPGGTNSYPIALSRY